VSSLALGRLLDCQTATDISNTSNQAIWGELRRPRQFTVGGRFSLVLHWLVPWSHWSCPFGCVPDSKPVRLLRVVRRYVTTNPCVHSLCARCACWSSAPRRPTAPEMTSRLGRGQRTDVNNLRLEVEVMVAEKLEMHLAFGGW